MRIQRHHLSQRKAIETSSLNPLIYMTDEEENDTIPSFDKFSQILSKGMQYDVMRMYVVWWCIKY